MNSAENSQRLSRRRVLQWFTAMTAANSIGTTSFGQNQNPVQPATKGYGQDPDLIKTYEPGDAWPLIFSKKEKRAATALADILFPKDNFGPSASELRVPDYIDEWISAPYPRQVGDRNVIRPGLKWLDEEAQQRFQKDFADSAIEQQKAIVDDLCQDPQPDPKLAAAAGFYLAFTAIASGAYYSMPEGWEAIGYVGNVPVGGAFPGPPDEVLKQAGLEQTVADE